MSNITTARWVVLKHQLQGRGILVEKVNTDVENLLIGVDEEGCLHLMIAIGENPVQLPQELEGIVVQIIEMDRVYLDISAKGHYEMLFTPMANQIFQGVSIQRRDPMAVVLETIEEFRSALKPLKPALGLSEQIGLFGEIWVLRNVLIPAVGARACYLWSGPDYERHDFIGENLHIEVKTTIKSVDQHQISRIDQLRVPKAKKLFFASIQLEKTIAGEKSLATLIDEVIEVLGVDGRAIDWFEARLSKLGWHDGLRQSGELKKFNLRDVQFFEVEGSFPRLPDDYVPPRGVIAIKYVIDVSARPVLDFNSVTTAVQSM